MSALYPVPTIGVKFPPPLAWPLIAMIAECPLPLPLTHSITRFVMGLVVFESGRSTAYSRGLLEFKLSKANDCAFTLPFAIHTILFGTLNQSGDAPVATETVPSRW